MKNSLDAQTDWGLPDWTQAGAYPNPIETTDLEWRWEFLRRRPDYREEWDNYPEYRKERPPYGLYAPSAPGLHLDLEWTNRRIRFGVNRLLDPHFSMSRDEILRTRLFDPLHAVRPPLWLDKILMRSVREKRVHETADLLRKLEEAERAAGLIDYRFDLTEPIEPQIRKARTALTRLQIKRDGKRKTARPRRNNWPLFLRALDARDCGATYADMSTTFWPDRKKTEQSARDTHHQAVQLRDNFPL